MTKIRTIQIEDLELGGVAPFSNVLYVDAETETDVPDQDGSVGAPFSTLTAAVAAAESIAGTGTVILLTPHDYSAESTITWNPSVAPQYLTIKCIGAGNEFRAQIPDISVNGENGAIVTLSGCECLIPQFVTIGTLVAQNCTLTSDASSLGANAFAEFLHCDITFTATTTCIEFIFEFCNLTSIQMSISSNESFMRGCKFFSGAPDITVTGIYPGVLYQDGESSYWWTLISGVLNNGTIVINELNIPEPLTDVRYVDVSSAVANPNGSIVAPFSDINDALASLSGSTGVLMLAPGFYGGTFTTATLSNLSIIGISPTQGGASISNFSNTAGFLVLTLQNIGVEDVSADIIRLFNSSVSNSITTLNVTLDHFSNIDSSLENVVAIVDETPPRVDHTSETSSTLNQAPLSNGIYLVTTYATVISPGSTGTLDVFFNWEDNFGSPVRQMMAVEALPLNVDGYAQSLIPMYLRNGSNISYTVDTQNVTGGPNWRVTMGYKQIG